MLSHRVYLTMAFSVLWNNWPTRTNSAQLLSTSNSLRALLKPRSLWPVREVSTSLREQAICMRDGGLGKGKLCFVGSSRSLPSSLAWIVSPKIGGSRNGRAFHQPAVEPVGVRIQAEVERAMTCAESEDDFGVETRLSSEVAASLQPSVRGVVNAIGNARTLDCLERSIDANGKSLARNFNIDWKTDERVRRSCDAHTSLRVAVLLSGGVDSSVALRLLCDAGHSCTAFYLKIWFQENFENFWSSCPWEEDLTFAQDVCHEAGVELKMVHLTDAYWGKVVSESILEIQAGRTPNPDILCNSKIKFGEFMECIKDEKFDRVASGHYARIMKVNINNEEVSQLCLSADEAKDQTYFLSQLSQSQLSRVIFPLGELSKAEVRNIAGVMGLSNKERKDSQGICFLGKVKFREFLARHLGEKEGFLLEAETGEILGVHKGFWFYTIGQRQGICLSNGPWFVVAKDVDHNVIFISRKYYVEKKRRSFKVGSFNWASGSPPSSLANMLCKVRHGPQFYHCTLSFDRTDWCEIRGPTSTFVTKAFSTAVVTLSEDDQGLAPGQYAAFYQNNICLGSGVIIEALGVDTSVNVSHQALDIAKVCNNPDFLRKVEKMGKKKRHETAPVGDVSTGQVHMESISKKSTEISQLPGFSNEEVRKRPLKSTWLPLLYLESFIAWLFIR